MSYPWVMVLAPLLGAAVPLGMFFVWSSRARRNYVPDTPWPSTRRTAYHYPLWSPLPHDAARTEVQAALTAAGGKIAWVEPQRICATRGPTFLSYGQVLTVWLDPMQQGTNLLIESKPLLSTTLFDWGEGRRNAEAIVAVLAGSHAVTFSGSS